MQVVWVKTHGKRESNTLVTYPKDGHNLAKVRIIPDGIS